MLTPILLDPLLFSFAPDELLGILEDLEPRLLEVTDILRDYPVHLTRFLNSNYVESISDWRIYQGRNGRAVASLIANLELKQEPVAAPARIEPHVDVGETWLAVLAETSRDTAAPFWRNPIIFCSNMRGNLLPDGHELRYTVSDGPRVRNLVRIGNQVEHPFFERDLDPWRLRTVGPPAPDHASLENRRNTWKRLPRPSGLSQNLTLRQVIAKLRTEIDPSITDKYFCFVPREDWDPLSIEKPHWRNDNVFRKKRVQYGPRRGESGYLDRGGRIWVWHDEKIHWDVQINEGATHINVSHTGRNLSV